MNIVTLDFETYFDEQYTLSEMTTEAYVRDPRFEVLCVHAQNNEGDRPSVCTDIMPMYNGKSELSWSEKIKHSTVLAHHAHFDGLILSHHFDIKPKFWLDTLAMARLVVPEASVKKYSLENLAQYFGLGQKTVPYQSFKGKHWENLSPQEHEALIEGCAQDVNLTYQLAKKLIDLVPNEELAIIDMTIRMFTEPQLIGDEKMLRKLQEAEWQRKGDMLIELGVTAQQLSSATKFCALLREEGLVVPTKEGKRGPIPAIAKTDPFIKELQDHDNPRVQRLVEARLSLKSTINETRAGRLADMASRGSMPVYLHYCGAHTTRWSGGDKVNFQNFPRGGDIRKALYAPKGFKLAICDLSQIECRVLNYVAGQQDILDAFAEGRDLYSEGAARFYGRPVNKRDNPLERHLGKELELACGYGMGKKKLIARLKYGKFPIHLSDHEAQAAIDSYRQSHPGVVNYWKQGDAMLNHLAHGADDVVMHWGPLRVYNGKILLPNDAPLHYELEWKEKTMSDGSVREGWYRKTREGDAAIWGGTLVENVLQAMSRVVLSQAMLRIQEDTALCPFVGVKPVLCTHDEVVYVVPEEAADVWYSMIEGHLKAEPQWLPGIPLDAEGGVYDRYEK